MSTLVASNRADAPHVEAPAARPTPPAVTRTRVARTPADLEANAAQVLTSEQRDILNIAGPALAQRGMMLCGGSALALYLGHRKAQDIDVMSSRDFSTDLVESDLRWTGLPVRLKSDAQAGFRQAAFTVGRTAVEATRMEVDPTGAQQLASGAVVPSYRELVAMKMASAAYRSTKRDIVDVYHLLQAGHTADELVNHVVRRYPDRPGMTREQVVASIVNCTSKRSHRASDPVDLVRPVPYEHMLATVQQAFARVGKVEA
jgi:hypothetical protein